MSAINRGSKGKKIRKKNGTDTVTVYSLNGSYKVKNQRYVLADGSASSYLSLASSLANGQYSAKLGAFIEEWVEELSYEKMSRLLAQLTGSDVLTASGVQSYIERKAEGISRSWVADSQTAVETIEVEADIAIYEESSKEVILMVDDVGVKAQKPHKIVERSDKDPKRLDTTVILVGGKEDSYHYATSGANKAGETIYSTKSAIIDTVCKHHDCSKPLPVVAIVDGAKTIRLLLQAIFGMSVRIILDWYHLQLKVKTLMSMIACNKDDKLLFINDLKSLLWTGNVAESLIYIDNMPRVRNEAKRRELRTYLEKHEGEIINYGLRKDANKTIGSGRCEKANDTVVAHRQKKKGMAWSRTGSSALAILKVNRINLEMAA